jgi:hypothetical protein
VRATFLTQVHGGAPLPTSRRGLNRTVLVKNLHPLFPHLGKPAPTWGAATLLACRVGSPT